MPFLGFLLLPFLGSCFSEEVWDPADPRCEERRQEVKQAWDNYLGQAYSWIDRYDRRR